MHQHLQTTWTKSLQTTPYPTYLRRATQLVLQHPALLSMSPAHLRSYSVAQARQQLLLIKKSFTTTMDTELNHPLTQTMTQITILKKMDQLRLILLFIRPQLLVEFNTFLV